MFFHRVRSLLLPFLPARSCPSRALVSTGSVLSPDDTARLLAGMTVTNSAAAALSATPAFREHTVLMERDYGIIQTSRLVPMRSWSLSELAEISAATHTLFYVFGGPDVTTALELFPRTTTYVLIGLEPVGEPPHLSALDENALPSTSLMCGTV